MNRFRLMGRTGAALALLLPLIFATAFAVRTTGVEGSPAPSEKTASEQFNARKADVDAKDVDGLYRLALWARQNGLAANAHETFTRVLVVDADHKGARRHLGYELIGGLWLRGPAAMRAKGFVRKDGRWILEAEFDTRAERNRELEKKAATHLIALTSPDDRTRRYAAAALAEMPTEPLFRPMVETLQGGSIPARRLAVASLCDRIGTEGAIAAVIRASVMDKDASVRATAVSHLASLGNPDTLYPFLRALGSNYAAVRTNAAQAIGNFGDVRGIETVISRLNMTAGGGPRVNFQSITQLSYIRDFDVEIAQLSQVGDPIIGVLREGVILDIRIFKVERDMTTIEKRSLTGALTKLTGQDFGDNTKAWTSWWRKNKSEILDHEEIK